MQYESEGIIRRQIVKLITALFIHNKLRYVFNNHKQMITITINRIIKLKKCIEK